MKALRNSMLKVVYMTGLTALLRYPSQVTALYREGEMQQLLQWAFSTWVRKKGSQQMMNTPLKQGHDMDYSCMRVRSQAKTWLIRNLANLCTCSLHTHWVRKCAEETINPRFSARTTEAHKSQNKRARRERNTIESEVINKEGNKEWKLLQWMLRFNVVPLILDRETKQWQKQKQKQLINLCHYIFVFSLCSPPPPPLSPSLPTQLWQMAEPGSGRAANVAPCLLIVGLYVHCWGCLQYCRAFTFQYMKPYIKP